MLNLQTLKQICQSLDLSQSIVVGYSGGVDSHVLLHALHCLMREGLALRVKAVHVNHHLNPAANQWVAHCQGVCDLLRIPLKVLDVCLDDKKGESLEALAREARYDVIANALPEYSYFLTAHHQDDQAETVLLQLLRGAGPKGLSAMPFEKKYKNLNIIRPLLQLTRDEILAYAKENQLTWIEDSSNQDINFQRNYLRQAVMPLLKKTWPSCSETISRSAEHCAEAEMLIETLAEKDFKACVVDPVHLDFGSYTCREIYFSSVVPAKAGIQGATISDTVYGEKVRPGFLLSQERRESNPKTHSGLDVNQEKLSISMLQQLTVPRIKQVIRYWLRQQDFELAPTTKLNQIVMEVLPAKADAEPLVAWQGVEVRRYRDELYAMKPLKSFDSSQSLAWDLSQDFILPNDLGVLTAKKLEEQGVDLAKINGKLDICFRQGGETCRLDNRSGAHDLKKLFQEWGVPPWWRDRIPLLYHQGQLVCVVGFCVCKGFMARADEEGMIINVIL